MLNVSRQIVGIDANEANLIRERVGSNKFAFNILLALSKVKTEFGFKIYLSTPVLEDLPLSRENWKYRIIPPPKFWTQWRLPFDLYFNKPRPDLFLSLGHYAPRFSPVKSLVSIMDLGYLTYPEQLTRKDFWKLKHWTSYSIRSATAIITISEYSKREIIRFYHVDPKKICVVYPGYDKNLFRQVNSPKKIKMIMTKYNINKPFLIFVGALKPNKNLERLITAFSQLKQENLELVIVGKKGWLYDSIFRTVKELGLGKRVIFTGFVPEAELPYLLNGASLFVFPSLYEGFGIPVVEAMACGLPVLTSNVGSLPEVIDNCGVVVDPYSIESIVNGIVEGLKMSAFYKKLGLKRVNIFSWEKSAKEIVEIIKHQLQFNA